MIVIDRLLLGGIRFVLDKVAAAVESEMDDEGVLREELLAANMRLELGEIDEEEFMALEREILARLREIRERRGEGDPALAVGKVTGVEATFLGDERPAPSAPRRRRRR